MNLIHPRRLRLPPGRRSGADPMKLAEQYRRFGASLEGMPAIEVTEGRDGELMINDGVTRAVRAAKYAPDSLVPIVVIDRRPAMNLTRLPRVEERP
jgi:hypothetical protein